MFSLSLHELTACVYYKLAIERGLRGSHPDSERLAHATRVSSSNSRKYNSAVSGSGGGGSGGSPRVGGAKSSSGSSAHHGTSTSTSGHTSANNNNNSSSTGTAAPEATPVGVDYECKDAHNMDVQLAIRCVMSCFCDQQESFFEIKATIAVASFLKTQQSYTLYLLVQVRPAGTEHHL